MDRKNAVRSESILNQNTTRGCTDGSKLNGRVAAVFLSVLKKLTKQALCTWKAQHSVSRGPSYFRSGKGPAFGKKIA